MEANLRDIEESKALKDAYFKTTDTEAAKLIKSKDPTIEAMRKTLASKGLESAVIN